MRPGVFRIKSSTGSSSLGNVVWAPAKSLWLNGCLVAFVVSAPFATTLGSVVFFLVSTYVTLLFGHSIGMHRLLIHRTFCSSKLLERTLVYVGVLVGMAGPSGIIRVHDTRDWAQRQPHCHDFFSHRAAFWRDAFWNLNCGFRFAKPPELTIEASVREDPWYCFLDKTWILHQVPLAAAFCWIGGWPWVVWGVFARVFVSVAGHWTVTYYTHNPGPGKWRVPDAGVQASNLVGLGFLTMGECWHNNHHAFPESAKIGVHPGEFDPGWQILRCLEQLGLVWDLGLPRAIDQREDLAYVG